MIKTAPALATWTEAGDITPKENASASRQCRGSSEASVLGQKLE